jgi:hypothetical protein
MFRKIMSLLINKRTGPIDRTEIVCNNLGTPSNEAIALINYFKNDENNTLVPSDLSNLDDLYSRFEQYVKTNSEGDVLPRTSDIETELKISNKKRRELYNEAVSNNLIIKTMRGNKPTYKYNINSGG